MRNRLPTLLAALAVFMLPSCSPSAPAAIGSASDEQAIREIAGKYAAAYAAKDTAALGALVADDYETVEATGAHTQGRAAFTAMAAKDFAMMPAGMSMGMTASTTYVRWIDANHAVAGGTWETSPAMPPMPSKGSWTAVVVKQGDSWKMLSALGAADMSAMMPDTTKPKTP
ncbi:MAG TPA: DUF4440 domain-containing protein [Gemmatimonadales bacterium]|nr:DUF4440 domain-containing protein [Gemmatimonadales bacterium]